MKTRILSANERPSGGKPPFPTLRLSDLSGVLALESRSRWNHASNQVSSGLGRWFTPARPALESTFEFSHSL
jgi:hypothetical protein